MWRLFLVLSVIPLFLAAGMAWIARGMEGHPEQRAMGIAMSLLLSFTALVLLKLGGLSLVFAVSLVFFVCAAGYFLPELRRFFFFGKAPGKAPTE